MDHTKYKWGTDIYCKRGIVKAIAEDYVAKKGFATAQSHMNKIRQDHDVITKIPADRYQEAHAPEITFYVYTQWGFGPDNYFETFLKFAADHGYALKSIP